MSEPIHECVFKNPVKVHFGLLRRGDQVDFYRSGKKMKATLVVAYQRRIVRGHELEALEFKVISVFAVSGRKSHLPARVGKSFRALISKYGHPYGWRIYPPP